MSKTQDFLKEAFAGESEANRKYQAFAAKADKEGYTQQQSFFGPPLRLRQCMLTTI